MKKWLLFFFALIASSLSQATPLAAAEVFLLEVKPLDPNTFSLHWQIKPGYFLYRDRIKLTTPADSNAHIGEIRFPQAKQKTNSQGQKEWVYGRQLTLGIAVLGQSPGETLLTVHYQGCADEGFCYPPETQQLKLTIDEHLALTAVSLEAPLVSSSPLQPTTNIEQILANQHWLVIISSFFGFGLLLSFTPCILPMVPVLSGIIVGQGATLSTRKAFLLSLSYVLSMSITYAIVGAIVALVGANLQIIMQSPWAISIFSILFVVLAFSMFGFFELRLPLAWQAKMAKTSLSFGGGHYLGAAAMGSLSTLILSPCITAPMIGVLSYIAHSGNIILGSLTLFFLSLGMGTPLLLIGSSAGKWLPKAGSWMTIVKAFFGFMLIAVAIYLMSRIIPAGLSMVLWGSLFVFAAIFSEVFKPTLTALDKCRQASGLVLFIYGVLIIIGGAMGNSNPFQPLTTREMTSYQSSPTPALKTLKQVKQAIENAKGKPVMLDFYADWCTSCKVMEHTTFSDPVVQKALANVVILKIDLSANSKQNQALLNYFKVVAPPTFIFFNREGKELVNARLVGELGPAAFLQQLPTNL